MKPYTIILGGGESGIWSAILAKREGHQVLLSDAGILTDDRKVLLSEHDIPYEEGGHQLIDLPKATQVVKSPGIPDTAAVIVRCREVGVPIISDIEFAARYVEPHQLIGITGSNGKTTTTSLVTHLLLGAGLDAVACGNIGKSLSQCIVREPHDYYVVELSSFQLDHTYDTRFHIALLLNITPDHLDRYQYSLEKYADAKGRIFRNQTKEDFAIFSADDPETAKLLARHPLEQATSLTFGMHSGDLSYPQIASHFSHMALQGEHNAYNTMAALLVLKALHLPLPEQALYSFQAIEHRMELVGTWRGVRFVNDSKATNLDATTYALSAMPRGKTHLILGGTDKGNDYSQILDLVKEKCKTLLYLTTDSHKLHATFDPTNIPSHDLQSMDALQQLLPTLPLEEGDTLLLSPACASFDLFRNYEDRGTHFKALYHRLTSH